MLDELACTCEAPDCDRRLSAPTIEMATPGGVRRAYECDCGTVTVTVVAQDRPD